MTMEKDTETSEKHIDLRDVEPLRPVEEAEPTDARKDADRVGLTAAAAMSSTPAVGVTAEVEKEAPDDGDGLDELRR